MRTKGLNFWSDDKFMLRYRSKNKKLYSLYVIKAEEKSSEKKGVTKFEANTHNPYTFFNALERVTSLNTLRVIRRVDK